jgi:catalase
MSSELQKRLFANVARMMAGMPREIQLRQICDIFRAEPAFGVGLATALGFAVSREPIRVRSL